jgi:hypothetical protein
VTSASSIRMQSIAPPQSVLLLRAWRGDDEANNRTGSREPPGPEPTRADNANIVAKDAGVAAEEVDMSGNLRTEFRT